MTIKDIQEQVDKLEASKDTNKTNEWAQQCETFKSIAVPKTTAHHIKVDRSDYLMFIRFDALDPKDYPNGINDNSIFITFKADLFTNKVEILYNGHVNLSPKDKAEVPRYKYLAMKSMNDVLIDKGGKKFRKQTFKDMADLFRRTETYYKNVMAAVTEYTGGYPYKQGKELPTDGTKAA